MSSSDFTRRGDSRGGSDRRSGAGRDRSPIGGGNSNKRGRSDCRVFMSNLPYEFRWQDLKDLLRKEVGEVAFVELFTDDNDKPKGSGIVEFEQPESVKKAIDKLHRYDIDGRKIIVKEDYGAPRDKCGNLIRSRDRPGDRQHDDNNRNNHWEGGRDSGKGGYAWGETYGLSQSFLEGLNISPPLVCRVFVANLDYKVTEKKLRDVFKLAGKVREVELSTDADGKSRGFAVVEYDHPVESVQAISMLHNQQLYDRRLTVRMDRVDPQERDRLPEGLTSVGMGLGQNGVPLKDVARNLPNASSNSNSNLNNLTAAAALSAPLGGLGHTAALQAALNAPNAGAGLLPGSNLDLLTARADISALSNLANLGAAAGLAPGLASGLSSLNSSLGAGLNSSLGAGLNSSLGAGLNSSLGGGLNSNLGSGLSSNNGLMGSASKYISSSVSRDSFDNRGSSHSRRDDTIKSSDTIVVDNLPPNYTWQDLKDKFRDGGEIKFAEMRGKLGLVRYASDWEALRAISLLDRTRVDGQTISVRLL